MDGKLGPKKKGRKDVSVPENLGESGVKAGSKCPKRENWKSN
jgi:hypothetical protein